MNKHVKYLNYLVRHKWHVFKECKRLGIWWRGIFHDWTKFTPTEYMPYVNYFNEERTEAVKDAFTKAWNHHLKANKHHWQYWVVTNDDGRTHVIRMPDIHMKEMLADWKGASIALGFESLIPWYERTKAGRELHSETESWIERMIYYGDY